MFSCKKVICLSHSLKLFSESKTPFLVDALRNFFFSFSTIVFRQRATNHFLSLFYRPSFFICFLSRQQKTTWSSSRLSQCLSVCFQILRKSEKEEQLLLKRTFIFINYVLLDLNLIDTSRLIVQDKRHVLKLFNLYQIQFLATENMRTKLFNWNISKRHKTQVKNEKFVEKG